MKVKEDVQVHFIDGEGFARLGLEERFEPFVVARWQLKVGGVKFPLRFWRKSSPVEIEVETVFQFDEAHKVDRVRIDRLFVNGQEPTSLPNVNIYGARARNALRVSDWLATVREQSAAAPVVEALNLDSAAAAATDVAIEDPATAEVSVVPSVGEVLEIESPKKAGALVKEKLAGTCKQLARITENCYKSCTTKDAMTFCALGGAADLVVQLSSKALTDYCIGELCHSCFSARAIVEDSSLICTSCSTDGLVEGPP
jgi:hypothetical protein